MRQHGTLVRWNDDRGFGFIKPANGKADLFVHISAFPREGGRPRLNELISFEVESGADGKQRAVRIMRPAQRTARPSAAAAERQRPGRRRLAAVLPLLVIGVTGWFAYSEYRSRASLAEAASAREAMSEKAATARQLSELPASRYSCDGRTMCSQMTSCEEATYFIRNCPGTEMDGDRDGRPCESQWCN